jgi:hypothetical protein
MNIKFYTNFFKGFILFFASALIITSCQKVTYLTEEPVVIPVLPDFTTKVNSSVSGFVTDENEAVVRNATVLVGTTTTTTDKYGYFEAKNVQMVQNAAVVTVTKAGYFKGIKTYIATANKGAFFRIKLMPKTNVGTVNGSSGGILNTASGLGLSFPVNAIVNASTNAAYSGTVNVSAFYINPTATDIDRIMPGDLRGINTTGNLQLLTSFGMVAVELTGAGGELLQIAAGKKVKLSATIPAALSATAPNTIPLWSFDETKGLWVEEGVASKNGNAYVGDVSHFSFWNYDVPANYVLFNCTVVNTAGQPMQNVKVRISRVTNAQDNRLGFTDSSGYLSGAIPNNAQLLLEVLGNANCANVILSQTITTTNVNVNYGNIVINSATNIATINGVVTDCSGAPVTNGFVIIQTAGISSRFPLSATGTYSVPLLLCGTSVLNYTIFSEDLSSLQQGNPVVYPIVAGVNTIPTIQACGTSTARYINTTVNGVASNFIFPTDNIVQAQDSTNVSISFNGQRIPFSQTSFIFIGLTRNGIAVGSTQSLTRFFSPLVNSSTVIASPSPINITEYGNVGQYIAGNFTAVINSLPPATTVYNVTCNFRIRRDF